MQDQTKDTMLREEQHRLKKSGNRLLVYVLVIFFAGYALFFTSRIWMPNSYEDWSASATGASFEDNGRKVTLIGWLYNEEDLEMEVVLDIENTQIDGMEHYSWTAMEIGGRACDLTVVVDQPDFVVLKIHPKKNWSVISVHMDGTNPDISYQTIRMYQTREDIARGQIPKAKAEAVYRRQGCDMRIAVLENQIDKALSVIEEEKAHITDAEQKIQELSEKEKFQTETETAETLEVITSLEGEITSSESKIQESKNTILDYQERIKLQKELKESYK